ncbi:MAG: hypothetical protein ACTHZX_09725 [Microbacterium sp.]
MVGAALLGFLVLIVISSLERGGSWVLFAVNLRIWALVVGIVFGMVVAPWALIRRMLRAESLVLSRVGVTETRSGVVRPGGFLPCDDIEEIRFERRARFAPRALVYRLTEAAARERGIASPRARTMMMRAGFEAAPRLLSEILTAAHDRFAREARGAAR